METTHAKQRNRGIIGKLLSLLAIIVLTGNTLNAQTVCGKVISTTDNSALIGVNVIIKGTTTGLVTDPNGQFCISLTNNSATLVFQYVGFQQTEKLVNAGDTITVAMLEQLQSLDEVVVVGYGAQKRSMVTGASVGVSVRDSGRKSKKKHAPVVIGNVMEANDCAAVISSSSAVYFNPSGEEYTKVTENGFKNVALSPLSTFSIDVDRASYSNVRRYINSGQLPPADAVRIEEMINYFDYDYAQSASEHPFAIHAEYTACPWQENHKLLRVGLQGQKVETDNLPPSNLVFLIDVSGSMTDYNKLPLVKSAFRLLVKNLRSIDKVAIVVYAGAAGMVLPSTSGSKKEKIIASLDALQAGGSTAGAAGIELAYNIASENFIKNGNNRVILATDGDFNVGISSNNELERLIEKKRDDGIFLTCLGFGMGNYKDSKMEILANKGNGNYAYIDDMAEANKVFVNEFSGTLFTIAKDVKIQIEFNPQHVQAYRLIGYENRMLNTEDFKDDKKDAGEMGAGHTVTALYEIIPTGTKSKFMPNADNLKYQQKAGETGEISNELANIKSRYKKPDGTKSIEMVLPVSSKIVAFNEASENTRFAASVAMFGMMLTNSEYKGTSHFAQLNEILSNARTYDKEGYKGEFVRLVKTASGLGLSAGR